MNFDNIIRAIGSNPYLVALGLLVTISPVVLQLIRALLRGVKHSWHVARHGVRRQAFRQQIRAIKGRVLKDKYGFFTKYDLRLSDIYILVAELVISASFFIASSSFIYIVFYSTDAAPPMIAVASYSILAGLAGISWVKNELQIIVWRKEFVLKNMTKEMAFLEKIHDDLVEERDELMKDNSVALNVADEPHS